MSCSAIPRRHILLVDDEPVIAFALGEVLQTFGHRVSIATHALLALDIDSGDGADLLITDLNMPDVDGLDLIRRIRAKRPALPVIVLTGRPPPGGRAALAGGDRAPTELLFKPATPTELHQAIQRVLGW
ncbi:response regulator [Azospirillum sp. sgz302134]